MTSHPGMSGVKQLSGGWLVRQVEVLACTLHNQLNSMVTLSDINFNKFTPICISRGDHHKPQQKKIGKSGYVLPPLQVFTKQSEIGIGQATIVPYRYKMIEYLPWMYLYNFEVESQRPFPITTYDTLTYPFDSWTWGFLVGFSAFVFIFLVFIQKLWIHTTGERPPNGWIFQGNLTLSSYSLRDSPLYVFCLYSNHSYLNFSSCLEHFKRQTCHFRPCPIPHCWSG